MALNIARQNITHSNHIPKHVAPRFVAVTHIGNTYYVNFGVLLDVTGLDTS